MSTADLYPGYETVAVDTEAGTVFAHVGGEGPPLLLLHGFPQTGAMWHRVAPALQASYRLVIPDLPGYGRSPSPSPGRDHAPHSKRATAAALRGVMRALGHDRFGVAGHDRGGRVAYRLALDHPDAVERLAVLDIAPTFAMWQGLDRAKALQIYHWMFLAQPQPFPENTIGSDPLAYLDWTLASWTACKDLTAFDPRALADYREAFAKPEQLRGMCEDYRAGATLDVDHDTADLAAGRTITCPVLALFAGHGIPGAGAGPLDAWRRLAPQVTRSTVPGGHFLCEEAPAEVSEALLGFFGDDPQRSDRRA